MPTYPITVTTRVGKGSPINAGEFDANMTNLRDATTDLNSRVTTLESSGVPNADKVDGAHAAQTPAAGTIPVADTGGKIDTWVSDASTSAKGKIQLATSADILAGTDAFKAVTPAGIAIGALGLSCASEVAITGAISLSSSSFGRMHVCTGTTADYTVTLPPVAGNAGKLLGVRIANSCTKLVTLDGNEAELIDGAATRVLWAGESAVLLCDGAGWTKIAGKTIPMMCKLSANATQSIPTGAYTTVAMGTVSVNIGGIADVQNNMVVIKRPGQYNVIWQASMATATKFMAMIDGYRRIFSDYGGEDGGILSPISALFDMSAGGTVTGKIFQESGSPKNTGTNPFTTLSVQEVPSW